MSIIVNIEFIRFDDRKPPQDNEEWYGSRYSIPVLVLNAITGQIFDKVVMFDFEQNGWVYNGLQNGPDPCDYEICHVTHWAKFPRIPRLWLF